MKRIHGQDSTRRAKLGIAIGNSEISVDENLLRLFVQDQIERERSSTYEPKLSPVEAAKIRACIITSPAWARLYANYFGSYEVREELR